MRAASDAFGRALTRPHKMSSVVDVLFNRQVVAEGVEVVSGSVEYDRTAARLARVNLTIADPVLVPVNADDVLTPYGFEVRVWRGVDLPMTETTQQTAVGDGVPALLESGAPALLESGAPALLETPAPTTTTLTLVASSAPEYVPLGVFPIQTSAVDGVTLVSQISGVDRSQLVSDARFEDDYQIAKGTNYVTAIQALIESRVAGLRFEFPTTNFKTPLLTFAAQSDPWDAAQKMAKSIGRELFFDGLGRCVMRSEPTFSGGSVALIAEGTNMLGAGLELDRSTAYNKVIARSQNASTGVTFEGEAIDDDPTSPTYYSTLGFGLKPRFFYSEFINSNEQARAAAEAILASNLGVSRSLSFSALPDPRLECGDVVTVVNAALGVEDLHIVDTLSIGLGPEDEMIGTSRTRQAAPS